MVSPRRTRHRPSPRASGTATPLRLLLVALVTVVTAAVGAVPAAAQPQNLDDALAELERVQREAEELTEQWHAAKDELAARNAELETLRAAVEPARQAAEAARAEEESYRQQIDELVTAAFEGGNLDQLDALLSSESPEDFLERMAAVESLAAEHRAELEKLLAVVENTRRAEADATAAVERAERAAEAARLAEQEILARKRDAEIRIDEVERMIERLSPEDRRRRIAPGEDAPKGPITGSGVGVAALRAAATQLGKPYQWGAEGPNAYDCSGLVYWAFKQVGVTLPRSSKEQAKVGRAVSWNELQPGDLVFYYEPVSHVGIYAGDGKMINAPQTGDVVKYQKVNRQAFSGARRI